MIVLLVLLSIGLAISCLALLLLYLDARRNKSDYWISLDEKIQQTVQDCILEVDEHCAVALRDFDERVSSIQMSNKNANSSVESAHCVDDSMESFEGRYAEVLTMLRKGMKERAVSQKTGLSMDKIRLIKGFGDLR